MLSNLGIWLSVIVAIITLIANILICGIYIGKLEGFKELINFRFKNMDDKLEKHNNFILRVYELEKSRDIQDHRISDLENTIGV